MSTSTSEEVALPCAFYRDPTVGDLVIRSSDGIDYHVHKDVMSNASPFFASMLSLPQPPSEPTFNGKPIVETQEDSDVWSSIIPLCYVAGMFNRADIALIRALLDAARKYEMRLVTESIRQCLLDPALAGAHPLSVFALGCAFELPDVARAGARHSLKTPVYFDYVPELELVSLRTWHALSVYRKACAAAALAVISWEGRSWLNTNFTAGRYVEVSCKNTKTCRRVVRSGRGVRLAWATYIDKLANLLKYTPDGTQACAPELLEPIMKSARDCDVCSGVIKGHVEELPKMIQRQVDAAVAKV